MDMNSQANAVVFAVPDQTDYAGAKAFEDVLASGEVKEITAVSGRRAGFCSRAAEDAVPAKEWFPQAEVDNPHGIPVQLDQVHKVIGSTMMGDNRWVVMLIADIQFAG